MYLFRRLAFLLIFLCLGCCAQSPAAKNAELNRRIENQVRSNFPVPADVNVAIGERKPSDIAGFDDLTVMLSRGKRTQNLHFFISQDNKTLAKIQKFDLSADLMSKIDVSGRPYRGGKDAKVIIVSFDDFECPFCSRMHQTLFPEISKLYGDKIKIIYKDYPMAEIHPWAFRAAVDANCLSDQNREAYWSFADYAHANQQQITGSGESRNIMEMTARLDKIVLDTGKNFNLDAVRLQGCISAQKTERVQASLNEANALGVDSTPTLFINGERVIGAHPQEEVRQVIDRALAAAGEAPPPQLASDTLNGIHKPETVPPAAGKAEKK